jgi:hypothetical protein
MLYKYMRVLGNWMCHSYYRRGIGVVVCRYTTFLYIVRADFIEYSRPCLVFYLLLLGVSQGSSHYPLVEFYVDRMFLSSVRGKARAKVSSHL